MLSGADHVGTRPCVRGGGGGLDAGERRIEAAEGRVGGDSEVDVLASDQVAAGDRGEVRAEEGTPGEAARGERADVRGVVSPPAPMGTALDVGGENSGPRALGAEPLGRRQGGVEEHVPSEEGRRRPGLVVDGSLAARRPTLTVPCHRHAGERYLIVEGHRLSPDSLDRFTVAQVVDRS
ncbi:hypothetical protein ACH4E7_41515 [Kitasatospora sp. NPDC018058]|uniref:hypothetical protein n=1 Tax=Kitasatospora sp. NPDC018058 TaxID=3364025 RepID=UPI0037BF35C9